MKKLTLKVSRPYSICISNNELDTVTDILVDLKLGNHVVIITNKTLAKIYKDKISSVFGKCKKLSYELIILPDTEKIKSFKYVTKICKHVSLLDFKKQVFFLGIGGGVVGDLTGFVASIIKRGRPFVNMPTSLLAQIDSSIGGKTAIDLETGKNLIGSFWQPSLVWSDVAFLKTLPKEQIKEGLGEAIKYALTYDMKLFNYISANLDKVFEADEKVMTKIVHVCSNIKRKVVQSDEREEKGLRTILNFGHTIGHAIETVSNYDLSHGKAVSLGMVAALYLSKYTKVLKDDSIIDKTIKLLKKADMPVKYDACDIEAIINVMNKDKKFISGKNRFVLLQDFEKPLVVEGISLGLIKRSLKRILL